MIIIKIKTIIVSSFLQIIETKRLVDEDKSNMVRL